MKSISKIMCFFFLLGQLNAQFEEDKLVIGLHAGGSLVGATIKTLARGTTSDGVDIKSTPALQLTADYSINRRFSVGVAFSHQRLSIRAEDFTFTEGGNEVVSEDFKAKFNRTQFAVRPLIHFGNSDKVDIYSGLRIGVLNRGFSGFEAENIEGVSKAFTDLLGRGFSGTRLSVGLTLAGLRYYFTEHIAAGIEINAGAPYIINCGVSTKF